MGESWLMFLVVVHRACFGDRLCGIMGRMKSKVNDKHGLVKGVICVGKGDVLRNRGEWKGVFSRHELRSASDIAQVPSETFFFCIDQNCTVAAARDMHWYETRATILERFVRDVSVATSALDSAEKNPQVAYFFKEAAEGTVLVLTPHQRETFWYSTDGCCWLAVANCCSYLGVDTSALVAAAEESGTLAGVVDWTLAHK